MSQTKYEPFLTIEIDHTFFNGENQAPISIILTFNTTDFFSDMDCWLNKSKEPLFYMRHLPSLW